MTFEQQKQIAYPNHNDVDVCRGDNVNGGQCEIVKIAYLGPGRLMMVMLILFVMIMSNTHDDFSEAHKKTAYHQE